MAQPRTSLAPRELSYGGKDSGTYGRNDGGIKMIDKIPMGINNIDEIIKKLREVIDVVNPIAALHEDVHNKSSHEHKQFHTCPECGCEYFVHLSSSSSFEGQKELLQCRDCKKSTNVQGFRFRRYEITSTNWGKGYENKENI